MDGLTGEPGAAAVGLVEVGFKHACAPALILQRPMVALTAKGVVPSPNRATPMDAQVSVQLVLQ